MNTGNEMDEGDLPIVARFYLYLSGTPFRALNSGEFIEEQIYNWTYSDVQSAKETWPSEHPGKPNPYEALPRMVMLTYQMPDEIRKVDENAGPEEKVSEFINFLSVLAYDGSAMRALMSIEGFRNLNKDEDIETIITLSSRHLLSYDRQSDGVPAWPRARHQRGPLPRLRLSVRPGPRPRPADPGATPPQPGGGVLERVCPVGPFSIVPRRLAGGLHPASPGR